MASPAQAQTLNPVTGMRLDLFNYSNAGATKMRQDNTDVVDYNTLRIEMYVTADGITEHFHSVIQVWAFFSDPTVPPPWRVPTTSSKRLKLWGELGRNHQLWDGVRHANGAEVTQTSQDLSTHTGLWMVVGQVRRPGPNDGEVMFEKSVIFRKV